MAPSEIHGPDMGELRNRYEELKRKKITAEANLKTSSQTLDSLQEAGNGEVWNR